MDRLGDGWVCLESWGGGDMDRSPRRVQLGRGVSDVQSKKQGIERGAAYLRCVGPGESHR